MAYFEFKAWKKGRFHLSSRNSDQILISKQGHQRWHSWGYRGTFENNGTGGSTTTRKPPPQHIICQSNLAAGITSSQQETCHSQDTVLGSWLTILRSLSQQNGSHPFLWFISKSKFQEWSWTTEPKWHLVLEQEIKLFLFFFSGAHSVDQDVLKLTEIYLQMTVYYTEWDKCCATQSSLVARDKHPSFSSIQSMCKRGLCFLKDLQNMLAIIF